MKHIYKILIQAVLLMMLLSPLICEANNIIIELPIGIPPIVL